MLLNVSALVMTLTEAPIDTMSCLTSFFDAESVVKKLTGFTSAINCTASPCNPSDLSLNLYLMCSFLLSVVFFLINRGRKPNSLSLSVCVVNDVLMPEFLLDYFSRPSSHCQQGCTDWSSTLDSTYAAHCTLYSVQSCLNSNQYEFSQLSNLILLFWMFRW